MAADHDFMCKYEVHRRTTHVLTIEAERYKRAIKSAVGTTGLLVDLAQVVADYAAIPTTDHFNMVMQQPLQACARFGRRRRRSARLKLVIREDRVDAHFTFTRPSRAAHTEVFTWTTGQLFYCFGLDLMWRLLCGALGDMYRESHDLRREIATVLAPAICAAYAEAAAKLECGGSMHPE